MDTQMPHSVRVTMDIEDGREVHTASLLNEDGATLMDADMVRSPALYKFLVIACLSAEGHKMESFENGSNVMTAVFPADSEDKNWREACYAYAFSLNLIEVVRGSDVMGGFHGFHDEGGNFERISFTK